MENLGTLVPGFLLSAMFLMLPDPLHAQFTTNISAESKLVWQVLTQNFGVGCDLNGTNLSNAYLVGADFTGASLSNAVCTATFFDGAMFGNANLAGAACSGCEFDSAILTNANLTGANFVNADFTGASLRNANTNLANFSDATFNNTTMPDGSIRNFYVTASRPPGVGRSLKVLFASCGSGGCHLEPIEAGGCVRHRVSDCLGGSVAGNSIGQVSPIRVQQIGNPFDGVIPV